MAARIFMLEYLLFCYQGATVMIIFNEDLCISFTIARLAHSSLIMGGVLFQLCIYLRARNDPVLEAVFAISRTSVAVEPALWYPLRSRRKIYLTTGDLENNRGQTNI